MEKLMRTVDQFAELLDRSFHGGPWHGPAVAEVLEGVGAAEASARPIANAHSIWEIVNHLTLWSDVPRKRIDGERIEVGDEADWQPVENPSKESWQQAVAELERAHRQLHARLLELEDGELERPVAGSEPTLRGMILGVMQHNAYHSGQITLLRKLLED